jgi:uncharacterized membrane protein YdbT with pleckstrin-like domain
MGKKNKEEDESIVWKDRKRWLFFGLPWTFTKYTLKNEKLLVESGFFSVREDEVRLYRIMDISINRGLIQRMFKLGTVTCISADKSLPTVTLKNIKNSKEIKEKLSDMVESERERKRVSSREFMTSHYDGDYDDDSIL